MFRRTKISTGRQHPLLTFTRAVKASLNINGVFDYSSLLFAISAPSTNHPLLAILKSMSARVFPW